MENKSLSDFAEEYIEKGKKKFGRTPTYEEIEEIIAEEQEIKTLSDKLFRIDMGYNWAREKDIKEFIKIILDYVNEGHLCSEIIDFIREEAGPKLITK